MCRYHYGLSQCFAGPLANGSVSIAVLFHYSIRRLTKGMFAAFGCCTCIKVVTSFTYIVDTIHLPQQSIAATSQLQDHIFEVALHFHSSLTHFVLHT